MAALKETLRLLTVWLCAQTAMRLVRPREAAQSTGWHSEERRHHRIERRYWLGTFVFSAIAGLGAIATTLLSTASLMEARLATAEAHAQTEINRTNLQETLRADITVDGVSWVNSAKSIDPDYIAVKYLNGGKSPAQTTVIIELKEINTPHDMMNEIIDVGENEKCSFEVVNSNITIYPYVTRSYGSEIPVSKKRFSDSVNSGSTLYVQGCLKYVQYNRTYTVPFCYIVSQGEKKSDSFPICQREPEPS